MKKIILFMAFLWPVFVAAQEIKADPQSAKTPVVKSDKKAAAAHKKCKKVKDGCAASAECALVLGPDYCGTATRARNCDSDTGTVTCGAWDTSKCVKKEDVSKKVTLNGDIDYVRTARCNNRTGVWSYGNWGAVNGTFNRTYNEWTATIYIKDGKPYKEISCLTATNGGFCEESDNMVIKKTYFKADKNGMIVAEHQDYPSDGNKVSLTMFTHDPVKMEYCSYCICNGEDISGYLSCKKCTYYGWYNGHTAKCSGGFQPNP